MQSGLGRLRSAGMVRGRHRNLKMQVRRRRWRLRRRLRIALMYASGTY